MSQYFYGIKCEDDWVQSIFDLLVILAQQETRGITPSHITLQGPFEKEKKDNLSLLTHQKIRISNIEIFDTPYGGAVVFILAIKSIGDFWKKKQYPKGKPHLTIFQGEIDLCEKLFDSLEKIDIRGYEFLATPLQRINVKKQSITEFDNYRLIERAYKIIFCADRCPDIDEIVEFSEDVRIKHIVKIIQHLAKFRQYRSNKPTSFALKASKAGSLFS